ncbi:MAG: 50S ribosomal protein L4 [Patescibacteria group bacterium]
MEKAKVYNLDGTVAEELDLPPEVFDVKVDKSLLHRVLISRASSTRAGTAHTKTRDEVRGGGKKPWRQKGTGRARHGSIRSPIWKGGGVVFGPRNERNWERKVNVKVARKALAMAFSAQYKSKHVVVIKEFILNEAKTKVFVTALREMRAHIEDLKHVQLPKERQELLVVFPEASSAVMTRASRNVPGVRTVSAHDVAIEDVAGYRTILMVPGVIPILAQRTRVKRKKKE